MKTVFNDTAKVAHIWAHQTQPTARYRDNFRCDGALLFSYSTRVGHIVRRPGRDKNHIGELVAFLTAETYSVTTSRHMGDAWQATRHMERYAMPDLDNLSPTLATLARNFEIDGGKGARKAIRAYHAATDDNGGRWRDGWQYVEAARAVTKWIGDNVAAILASATAEPDSWRATGTLREAAELIGAMAGFTPGEVTSIIDKAAKADAKRKADAVKREHAARLAEGRELAAMSDSDFAATFPRDGTRTGADDYHAKEGAAFAKRLARLHKASKAAGLTTRTAELWRKVKLYRAHLAGRDARIIAAYRAELAADVRAWRAGGARPDAYKFNRFPAIKAALERSQAREWAERHAAEFAAWQAGEGKRPSATSHEKDSPEFAAIVASIAADRLAFLTRFAMWQRGEGERPAILASDAMPGYSSDAESDYRKISDAAAIVRADVEREKRERAEAEQRERERERFAKAAEFRRAWLAGERERGYSADGGRLSDETGGALIRATGVERDASGAIVGGLLETSHGADVPLAHAVKAFRFVKLVRERGETWRRNGRTIRVGHYQIDAIDAGGFTAGCHRINWGEIERLARELGVLDAPADDSAVIQSAHA